MVMSQGLRTLRARSRREEVVESRYRVEGSARRTSKRAAEIPIPHLSIGASLKQYTLDIGGSGDDVFCPDLGLTVSGPFATTEDVALRLVGTASVRNLLEGSVNGLPSATFFRHYRFGIGGVAALGHPVRGARPLVTRVLLAWRDDLEDHRPSFASTAIGIEMTYGQVVTLRGSHTHTDSSWEDGWAWGAGLRHRFDAYHGLHAALDYGSNLDRAPLDDGASHQWTFTAGIDLY